MPLLAKSELERDFESVKAENKALKAQLQSLEQVKADLVLDIDEEISNCLETKVKLKSAVTKLNNVESKYEFVETTLKQGEKRLLEKKHEQTCTVFKISKPKNIDIEKEIKTLSVAMKKSPERC